MKTDLERLHNVFDGELQGRGCGKTFLKCHDVASWVELGYKNIICITTLFKDTHYITPMLKQVFGEKKLELKFIAPGEFKSGNSSIKLTPRLNDDWQFRGVGAVLVPMGHWD